MRSRDLASGSAGCQGWAAPAPSALLSGSLDNTSPAAVPPQSARGPTWLRHGSAGLGQGRPFTPAVHRARSGLDAGRARGNQRRSLSVANDEPRQRRRGGSGRRASSRRQRQRLLRPELRLREVAFDRREPALRDRITPQFVPSLALDPITIRVSGVRVPPLASGTAAHLTDGVSPPRRAPEPGSNSSEGGAQRVEPACSRPLRAITAAMPAAAVGAGRRTHLPCTRLRHDGCGSWSRGSRRGARLTGRDVGGT